MHFLLFALGIVFYSTSCDSHKLVCDGEPIDHHTYSFDHVRISFVNADSKDIDFDNLEDFNPSRKTVLIIHGLPICELSYRWAFELGKIWPKWESANIVVVQWTMSVIGEVYKKSALSTEHVASTISKKILELVKTHGSNMTKNFHFLGHSLGAHIAGQAARSMKNNGIRVQRVTGFDPADPCFENKLASLRLRKTDARFVDVYHSNSDLENKGNLGTYNMIGHIDFYLNGGNNQPELKSCSGKSVCYMDTVRNIMNFIPFMELFPPDTSILDSFFGVNMKHIVKNVLSNESYCHHVASCYYFIESMDRNSKKRWANPTSWPVIVTEDLRCQNKQCEINKNKTCIEMGINARLYKKHRGAFYVDTWNNETANCYT